MTDLRIAPPSLVQLGELHEEFRATFRPNAPPEWFSFEVGNKLLIMPEDKFGHQVHFPVCRPDTMDGAGFGWNSCDFMFVLPMVTAVDVSCQACMVSRWGAFLREELRKAGFDLSRCLVTHALRFALPPGFTSYGSRHKTSNATFVRTDCYACNPKVIITFGSDALKALFGKDAKMDQYRGNVPTWEGIPVIPTVSPLTFAKSEGGIDVFRSELFRAMEVATGLFKTDATWKPGYRVCSTLAEVLALEAHLDELKPRHVAIDTEFGNNTGREEHGYLRSFQLAWDRGQAAYIKLRECGGKPVFTGEDVVKVRESIARMMKAPGRRLDGQHLRVDVEMPSREGIVFDEKLETGWDTMLCNWLLRGADADETKGLDHLVRRYEPQLGAYWAPLERWLDSSPDGRSRNDILQFGYRDIPDDILILYALIDADATWCIAEKQEPELRAQPDQLALFQNIVMPASLHLLDVERQGILQDRQRVKELREIYQPVYDSLLAEFRDRIGWPEFNPGSGKQKAAYLYSTTNFRGHAEWLKKGHVPEGAKLLKLAPLFNTDKYPREWSKIVEEGEEERNSPSCKAATIDLLYQKHKDIPELRILKSLSVLAKFLSDYLCEAPINELGYRVGGKSIACNVWDDGRARGHISQTTGTGRCSMRAANLQTTPKKQEDAALAVLVDQQFGGMELDEYKKCCNDKEKDKLGDRFIPKHKRVRVASFKSSYVPAAGNVFIEVDFKTAELCVLAYASGDEKLIAIIERGRDLHAETATNSFNLPGADEMRACVAEIDAAYAEGETKRVKAAAKAYKDWLHPIKEGEYSALRTAAKTVTFGIAYGRGAYALAREISKTGNAMTPDETQKIIDTFAATFPDAWKWLQSNMDSAIENGFVANPFGFRRYFHGIQAMSEKEQAAARREASNAPIQGCLRKDTIVYIGGKATRIDSLADRQLLEVEGKAAVAVHSGIKETVCVRFAGGRSIDLTPDHRVLAETPSGQDWVEAGKLLPGTAVRTETRPLPDADPVITATSVYRHAGNARKHGRTLTERLDPDFAWMLGSCVGDGSLSHGANNATSFLYRESATEELTRARNWLAKLSLHVTERTTSEYGGGGARNVPLTKLYVGARVLRDLFGAAGLPPVRHTEVRVPTEIFNATEASRWAFLDGYWSADGTISTNVRGRTVTWCTASRQLAVDIGNLLATMGVFSTWFEDGAGYYRGTMNGTGCDRFLAAGGFTHPEKQKKLKESSAGRTKSTEPGCKLPNWLALRHLPEQKPVNESAQTIWYRTKRGDSVSRQQLLRLAPHGFTAPPPLDIVQRVEAGPTGPTFDLSVATDNPEDHQFTANGITVHNCVAFLLLQAGIHLYRFRYRTEAGRKLGFKINLPIHDAFLVETPTEFVKETIMVIELCMSKLNPIPGPGGRSLGVDITVYPTRWGTHEDDDLAKT